MNSMNGTRSRHGVLELVKSPWMVLVVFILLSTFFVFFGDVLIDMIQDHLNLFEQVLSIL